MRFYVKLSLLVASFAILASLGGETGRQRAWEVSFAARCYVAERLADEQLMERLVCEARARIQRERDDPIARMIEQRAAAPHLPPPNQPVLSCAWSE